MNTFKLRLLSIVVLASLLAVCSGSRVQARAGIIYVDRAARGRNNGTSWADAYTNLQSALSAAMSGDEIWVAEGVYKPTSGANRHITFQLIGEVDLYGGFAGTETAISERDLTTHVTTLSGDIGTAGEPEDNSHHVVTGNDSGRVTLDGFTITDGNAHGDILEGRSNDQGGGLLYRPSEVSGVSNLNLRRVVFRDNLAWMGGGMYSRYGDLVLEHVTFEANVAALGGGMYINNSIWSRLAMLDNVTFKSNYSNAGGAILNNGTVMISNSTFYDNHATSDPLPYAQGGGIHNYGSMMVVNSTFSHNSAEEEGGAIYNFGRLTLTNNILANSLDGGDCYTTEDISGNHNLIENNASAPYACGTPSFTGDPLLGPLQDNGGFTQTMALLPGSPAIDTDCNLDFPGTDQRGIRRSQDGDNDGSALCDLGAYEREPAPGVGVYDDVHDGWIYTDFTARTATGAYDGTFHISNIVGGTAEFVFNGSQIILTYSKHSSRGELDVYIDDVLVTTIDQYNATRVWQASWMSDDLGPGLHRVRLVHAGPSGSTVDIDAIEVMTYTAPKEAKYDDGDSGWKYNNFIAAKMTGPYLGTFHYSKAVGSMAEFVFTGSQITLWYSQYSNHGKLAVYIDDKQSPVAIIDQYNATRVWQASWMSDDLGPGLHRVRLVHVSGALVDIDAIEIFP